MNGMKVRFSSTGLGALIGGFCLLLVAGTVYGPALSHEILDLDYSCWIQAVQPVGPATIKRIVTCDSSVWEGLGYFAPLTALSFMADLWMGSLMGDPALIHKLVNVVLHLSNTLLVLWLLRALGFGPWVAVTAALLFSVHPLQVSTVAWIAERKNLLMCFFFLVSLSCYCRYRHHGTWVMYMGFLMAFLLSLFAKPAAVSLAGCVFITDWFIIDRRPSLRSLARCAPLVVIGILWVAIAAGTELPVDDPPRLLDRILLAPYNVGFLLGKFFLPTDLALLYPTVSADSASVVWWVPMLLCAVIGGGLWLLNRAEPVPGILWGLGFYVLNLLPSSGIVPFAGMKDLYVADHYQYVACIGMCLVVSLAVDRAFNSWNTNSVVALRVALTAALVLVLSLRCTDQLRTWQNPETLWRHVLTTNPSCFHAHFNFGTYLDGKGRFPEAATHYTLALAVGSQRHDSYKLYYNLGLIMMKYGQMDKAVEYLERALEVRPRFGLTHLALAQAFLDLGKYPQAMEHCRRADTYGARCLSDEMEKFIWHETRNTADQSH